MTILLVEQNAERVFGLADRVHVMSGGEFALSGTAGRDQGRSGASTRPISASHMREAAGDR